MPPIFIVSTGHSFTSVVCAMLGQHPALYGVPELNLYVADTLGGVFDFFHNRRGKRFPDRRFRLLSGLARLVAQIHDGQQTEDTVGRAREWLRNHEDWSTQRLAQYLAEAVAPRAMVDKSPSNLRSPENLQRMAQIFPDAKYLHLTRHPHSNCESIYRNYQGWMAKGWLSDRVATQGARLEQLWFRTNRQFLDMSMTLGPRRYARVQGEALVAEPDVYLPQIAAWLEIDTSAAAIEAMKHPEASPFSCVGPANAPGGNNVGFLEAPALRKYTPKASSLHAHLPWVSPDAHFAPETVALAHRLGYV
jgi:sulfotransferase family protein